MDLNPHPHVGLQTVSWLFAGEIEHRDSTGSRALVRPGQVNLMTAGAGIAHSETSTAPATALHGVQLWIALPGARRAVAPFFEHHAPEPIAVGPAVVWVFVGELAGTRSAITTFVPLLGAQWRYRVGPPRGCPSIPRSSTGCSSTRGTSGCRGHPWRRDRSPWWVPDRPS